MSLTDQYYVDPSNYEMPEWTEFYQNYAKDEFEKGNINAYADNPDSFFGNLFNIFNGVKGRAWTEYERQKNLKEKAYEEAKLKSARDYQLYLESSKYQRGMEDIRKAGYNPAIMLQSGLGAANVQPGPASNRNSAHYSKYSSNDEELKNLGTSAMKLIALIAMMASA